MSRPPAETLTRVLNSTQFYQRLGRLAAGDPLPFVGTVAFAAGPADSVIGVLGLSLENRALAFQREGNVFVARYRVSLSFKREGAASVDVAREEIVRVPTFQETLRSDESILFQQVLRLLPGNYAVSVTVRDVGSTSESRAQGDFTAPCFAARGLSAPILVYQATGRGNLADPLNLVLNPRGAVGYGSDTLLAYVEGYRFAKPTTVPFKVIDEQQHVIHEDELRFRGGTQVESQVVRLSPDSVSLGELQLVGGRRDRERRCRPWSRSPRPGSSPTSTKCSICCATSGTTTRSSAMRKAPESERARMWREFYAGTDPNSVTPGERGAEPVFRPHRPGQPAVHRRRRARLADRPRRGLHQPRPARRGRSRTAPGRRPTGSSGGRTSTSGWSSSSATRAGSAACGCCRAAGRTTSGRSRGCGAAVTG